MTPETVYQRLRKKRITTVTRLEYDNPLYISPDMTPIRRQVLFSHNVVMFVCRPIFSATTPGMPTTVPPPAPQGSRLTPDLERLDAFVIVGTAYPPSPVDTASCQRWRMIELFDLTIDVKNVFYVFCVFNFFNFIFTFVPAINTYR